MELPQETISELNALSKLLNGQLRGGMNAKAREMNLELIQLTVNDVYERGLNKGYEMGKAEAIKKEIQDEIKEGLTDQIQDGDREVGS